MQYYIKGNYYFDIDYYNQLRITGPKNHLLLGLPFPRGLEVKIHSYKLREDQLVVNLVLLTDEVRLRLPLVTDIRTLRNFIEPVTPHPSYEQLIDQEVNEVMPKRVEQLTTDNHRAFRFINAYTTGEGIEEFYGAEIAFPKRYRGRLTDNFLEIKGDAPLKLIVTTMTNIRVETPLTAPVFKEGVDEPAGLEAALKDLYYEAGEHIEHLIRTNKTSSFEYGTIFPRDWIESADLGAGDLTQETIDYMYQQSLKLVSDEGEGWHEDIVGEYKLKMADAGSHIDRKMIDIEPRYIMGIKRVSKHFLVAEENQQKLRLISKYVLANALNQDLIAFKKVPQREDQYHFVGNWRDSYQAFPRQKSPLAPYDVNCVLYPVSLRLIREYGEYFGIEDFEALEELVKKWDEQKRKFRLYHPGGIIGYSLALQGKKRAPLPIAHLDEGYDMFYGKPSMEEVASFAQKTIDPEYFYTPVGPILVAADEEDFSTRQYHGKVIWPKQAAFTVAGLYRQYQRGKEESWPFPVLKMVKQAAIGTAESSFKGFMNLKAIPELYYYDESQERARFYTDQEEYEGQMSLIQLWSAVGARRIMRDYSRIKEEE